jgi:hypothetical protein
VTVDDDSTAVDLGPIPTAEDADDEFVRRMGEEAERKPPKRRGRPSNADKEREFKEANKPLDPEKAAEEQRQKELEKWREPCPVDSFQETWHWALAHIHEQGWGPEQIQIVVIRLTPVPGQSNPQPLHLNPRIRGDQVLGDPDNGYPAGEALLWFVIDHYHRYPGVYGTYKLQFLGPDREHIAITKPFPLERWADLDRRREEINRDTAAEPAGPSGHARPPWRRGPGAPGAPGAPGVSPDMAAIYEELGRLRAQVNAPQPAPPPEARDVKHEKEIYELRLELQKEKDAREREVEKQKHESEIAAMNARIDALSKVQAAPPIEDLGSAMIKMLMTLGVLGPDGKPVGAGAPQPAKAAERIDSATAAFESVFDDMEKFEKGKDRVRKMLGFEAPPVQAIVETVEKEEEESFFVKMGKQAIELAMKNPEGIIAGLGSVLEGSPAGTLLKNAGAAMTAAKAAARTATSVPMGGAQGGGYKPPAA